MAAVAAGLVMAMTGCSSSTPPQGDDLYQQASAAYFPLAEDMHTVIMAVHSGTWEIEDGAHGARPGGCQVGTSDEFGYRLDYVRGVQLDDIDPEAVTAAAEEAFTQVGADVESQVRGSGEREQYVVIATSERIGRAVVTVWPARQKVRVTAETSCLPGKSTELTNLIFGEEKLTETSFLRLPITETPETVPQFYFPPEGPEYIKEDGTPVDPQPVVTDPPKAPYGS